MDSGLRKKRRGVVPVALWTAIPNALSLTRLALGLTFPWLPAGFRAWAVVLAGLTDAADGASARLLRASSSVGRSLDPVADRVFLLGVVATLVLEGALGLGEAALVGLRDWVMLAGVGWLLVRGNRVDLGRLQPRLLGKSATAAQLLFLLLVLCGQNLLPVFLGTTVLSGLAALDYLWAFARRPAVSGR
jgi:phosphatidylglycerophosphate synthase